jgi:hypothetical protein
MAVDAAPTSVRATPRRDVIIRIPRGSYLAPVD